MTRVGSQRHKKNPWHSCHTHTWAQSTNTCRKGNDFTTLTIFLRLRLFQENVPKNGRLVWDEMRWDKMG